MVIRRRSWGGSAGSQFKAASRRRRRRQGSGRLWKETPSFKKRCLPHFFRSLFCFASSVQCSKPACISLLAAVPV